MTADLHETPPRPRDPELGGLVFILGVVLVLTVLCALFL
jgi:hypothetical protein